jgi:hypothetical protein
MPVWTGVEERKYFPPPVSNLQPAMPWRVFASLVGSNIILCTSFNNAINLSSSLGRDAKFWCSLKQQTNL